MTRSQDTSQPGPIKQQLQKIRTNGQTPAQPVPQKKRSWGFREKTVWDWMHLIAVLLVPVVGIWFSIQINDTNLQIAKDNRNQDLQIAQKNREQDLAIEADRQRAEILKTYTDDITTLLLEKGLKSSKEGDEVREVARTKTFLALEQLNEGSGSNTISDRIRKGKLVGFIYKLGLMNTQDTIIRLAGANLKWADLSGTHLHFANLAGVDLSDANLKRAELSNAGLRSAELRGANLRMAVLRGANLTEANLTEANLTDVIMMGTGLVSADLEGADLREADLIGANLKDAYLWGANLIGANLAGVNLKGAQVANSQLSQVQSLKGATLPDGSFCTSEIPTDCLPKRSSQISSTLWNFFSKSESSAIGVKQLIKSYPSSSSKEEYGVVTEVYPINSVLSSQKISP